MGYLNLINRNLPATVTVQDGVMVPYSPSSTSAAKRAESSRQTESIVKVCILASSLVDARYLSSWTGLEPLSHRTRLGFDRVKLRQHSLSSRTSMSVRGMTTAQGSSTQFRILQDWLCIERFQRHAMHVSKYECLHVFMYLVQLKVCTLFIHLYTSSINHL